MLLRGRKNRKRRILGRCIVSNNDSYKFKWSLCRRTCTGNCRRSGSGGSVTEIVPQEEAVSEETVEESSEELTEEVTQSEAVQEEVTEEQTTVAQEEQAVEGVSAKESPAVENIDEAVTVQADGIVESGKCGDNVTYTFNSDGVLTISGSGDMYDYDYGYNYNDLFFTYKWKC